MQAAPDVALTSGNTVLGGHPLTQYCRLSRHTRAPLTGRSLCPCLCCRHGQHHPPACHHQPSSRVQAAADRRPHHSTGEAGHAAAPVLLARICCPTLTGFTGTVAPAGVVVSNCQPCLAHPQPCVTLLSHRAMLCCGVPRNAVPCCAAGGQGRWFGAECCGARPAHGSSHRPGQANSR